MEIASLVFVAVMLISVLSIVAYSDKCACGCTSESCTCDGGHCQRCAGCSICKDKPRPGCNCKSCRGK